jgi:hypothetical protein
MTRLAPALLACGLLAPAASMAAVVPRAPMPALASLVPSTAELGPGTKVIASRVTTLSGVETLMRVYDRPGGLAVVLAMPDRDGAHAATDFGVFRTEVGLKSGRAEFAKAFGAAFVVGADRAKGVGGATSVVRAVVGKPVSRGPNAFRFAATLKLTDSTTRVAFAVIQVDRVLDVLAVFSHDAIPPATVDAAIDAVKGRLAEAFTVRNLAAPSIAGVAAPGQALKLDAGAWAGAPSDFAYAWSRCDASGASCAPIPGATAGTYLMGAADSGATLRVTVAGSNTVSSGKASSPATAVVE